MKYMIFPGGAGGNFLANIIAGNESQPDNISNEYFMLDYEWKHIHDISGVKFTNKDTIYVIDPDNIDVLLYCWVLGRLKKLLDKKPITTGNGTTEDRTIRWTGLQDFNIINQIKNIKDNKYILYDKFIKYNIDPCSLLAFRILMTNEPLDVALFNSVYHKDTNYGISNSINYRLDHQLIDHPNVTRFSYTKIFLDIDIEGTLLESYKQDIINYTEKNIKLIHNFLESTSEIHHEDRFTECFRYVEDRFRNRRNEP